MPRRRPNKAPLLWPLPPRALRLTPPFALVHGGLGPGDTVGHRNGRPVWLLKTINEIARKVGKHLQDSSALEICHEGVQLLERIPIFNAGLGSKLQGDGVARLSASVMDGYRQKMAAVSNLRGFVHASTVALRLLEEKDRLLGGVEASQYALGLGLKLETPVTEQRIREWEEKKFGRTGTVGCIAIDSDGHTAAMTSTGGKGMETPGRISDSCTPAGNYANPFGAISCTGVGEEILDACLAASVLTRLEDGNSLENSVHKTIRAHSKKRFGLIALDHRGRALVHATKGTLTFAVITPTKIYSGLFYSDWRTVLEESSSSLSSSSIRAIVARC